MKKIFLLIILLAGLWLRVHDLGRESLWSDEGYSVRVAKEPLSLIVKECRSDVHPPLYYFALHYWISFLGDSEARVRLLSALFGFLSIILIYRTGKLLFDERAGVYAALILALSSFHIQYSQEARAYSLLAMLSLGSFFHFLKIFDRRHVGIYLGYILWTALMLYTHAYGIFIIAAQIIFLVGAALVSPKKNAGPAWRILLLQAIVLCLGLPWLRVLREQAHRIQSWFWLPRPATRTVIDSFIGFSGSKILLAVFLALCCLSLLSLEEREKSGRNGAKINFANLGKICLLLLWLSLPIILPFIISQFSQPIYHTKYAICALPAFFLLAARGIEGLPRRSLRMAAILAVAILSSLNIHGYYSETRKEQWREAANYVDQKAMPGDLVLFNAGGPLFDVFNYYSQRTDITKQPFPAQTIFVTRQNLKELDALVSRRPRVWLVLSHSPDSEGLIKSSLTQAYILSDQKTYLGVELFLFTKK